MKTNKCKKCGKELSPEDTNACSSPEVKKCISNKKPDKINKNHVDELNNDNKERIKNNIEDGENFSGI